LPDTETMKARIFVTLKPSVLDPQGKTIHHALESIGYTGVTDVRQGKYFEITVDAGQSVEETKAQIERIAADVLSNPVIEDYRVELGEE
jgi:phosphoribosylformylglycinamidine synthase PurS subunit